MSKIEFTLKEMPARKIYGLGMLSSQRTQASDVQTLSGLYQNIIGKSPTEALPLFVVSHNKSEETQQFELFVGGDISHDELQEMDIPEGEYASALIAKHSLFSGMTIDKSRREFHHSWLPNANYESLNITCEYHAENSLEKDGKIELLFAVKKKENATN